MILLDYKPKKEVLIILDIIFEFVDLFLNFIIDDTVNKATTKNAGKNFRYILFSVLSAILLIVFAAMIVYTFKTGNLVIAFLFIALSIAVVACWCRLSYLINKKRK